MFTYFVIKISNLWNHSGFRRYFTNTIWLFIEKILRLVVGLFVSAWIARYLGPSKFGLLSYAQSFVALFGAIATLGLDGILVRELVKDESKRDVLLGTSFVLKLFGAFLVFLVLAVAVQFTKNDAFTNLLIFIIAGGLIFQSFNVIDLYFQSKVLSKFAVWANTFSFLTTSLIKIFLLIIKAPLVAFAIVAVCDTFFAAIGYVYFYSRHGTGNLIKWRFRFDVAKALLKDSWPLVFSGLVIMIYMRIDQVMIKNMLGDWAVGQYAAAVRLSEVWYFLPVVICNSLFPAVIRAREIDKKLYYDRLQKLYDFMVYIAIIIAVPVTFFSNFIINLFYGENYSKAGIVLMIHIWTGVFVSLGVASSKWFISENLQLLSFCRTLFGAIINIFCNILLIPRKGIQGAALATLIAQIFATVLFDFFYKKTREMFFMKLKTILIWRYLYVK